MSRQHNEDALVGFAYHHLLSGKWQIISFAWRHYWPDKKISSSSEAFCYLPCGRAFNCLRPQKDKKASRAHELVRISQESTAAYHFPQQNTLGEDKEKRRGLTTIADDEQFKQVVVVFGHFELGFLALRSLVLALADELVTKTQRKTANCSVSSREPLSSVARWITHHPLLFVRLSVQGCQPNYNNLSSEVIFSLLFT